MHTQKVAITIPRELARTLNEFAGPKKRSRFIVEAVKNHIDQKRKKELEMALEEGYRATAKETSALCSLQITPYVVSTQDINVDTQVCFHLNSLYQKNVLISSTLK